MSLNLPCLNGGHVQGETVDGAPGKDGEGEAREEVCNEEQEQMAQLEGCWSKVLRVVRTCQCDRLHDEIYSTSLGGKRALVNIRWAIYGYATVDQVE